MILSLTLSHHSYFTKLSLHFITRSRFLVCTWASERLFFTCDRAATCSATGNMEAAAVGRRGAKAESSESDGEFTGSVSDEA